MTYQFFIPMIPPTATYQEKKTRVIKDKQIHYEPAEIAVIRDKFTGLLMQHSPDEIMKPPIRLITKWIWPVTDNHPEGYKSTKPDTDNMIKLFKDCMTVVGFWKDDAHVASEITEKFYGDIPGIFVRVEEIEEH